MLFKFKKYSWGFVLVPILFLVMHTAFVYAQEAYFIGERIMTGPAPLFSLEVLNDKAGVTSFFVRPDATAQVPALYRIYRRCDSFSWVAVKEIKIEDCDGPICPETLTVPSGVDSCSYAASAVDSSGNEGTKSPAQKPALVSDSGDTIAQSDAVDLMGENPNGLEIISSKQILFLKTEEADGVEWSVTPKGGVPSFLGSAKFDVTKGVWVYEWDTTNLKDGEYILTPKIISNKGLRYQVSSTNIFIKNHATTTVTQDQKLVDDVQKLLGDTTKTDDISKIDTSKTIDSFLKEAQDYLESEEGQSAVKQLMSADEATQKETIKLVTEEAKKIVADLPGNGELLKSFQNSLIIASESSSQGIDAVAKEFGVTLTPEQKVSLEKEVKANLEKLQPIIEQTREVLKERTETDITKDTDGDGISDYDEKTIYHTDPKKADTNSDGVSDGKSILAGLDPLAKKAVAKVAVKYENPKTEGYVRDPSLKVEKIKVVAAPKADVTKPDVAKKEHVEIAGMALKNSFVTLYLFSTPIVVTLKTDKNGSWSYTLDKELPTGKHEIYVAMTDSKGKIVAKSSPLPFVKEAAAVTVDQAVFANVETNAATTLFDLTYLYAIGALIIAIIGAVLVLSGKKKSFSGER
jgi:hypothetical protein